MNAMLGHGPPPIADMDVEQALLGLVLYDMEAMHRLPPDFGPQHFHEPFHQRLFARIQLMSQSGRGLDGILAASAFAGDGAFQELGGTEYLGLLIERAPPSQHAAEYAATLTDLFIRRELTMISRDIAATANDGDQSGEDLLGAVERDIAALRVNRGGLRLISASEAIDAVFQQLDSPTETGVGVTTGLEPIDKHLGAWAGGEMMVLGGRPSMGKSALASVIAQNVAMAGYGVIELNGEMTVEQMMRRHLTSVAYSISAQQTPAYSDIRRRVVEYAQRRVLDAAAEILRGLPLMSLKKSGLTLSNMRSLARRQASEWAHLGIPLGLVVVDHVGLVKTDQRGRSRVEDQTEISGGLKELAGELNVPILALAQLNREVEKRDDKRPVLADLRDSGSWEQDADVVMAAYREAYYAEREQEPKNATGNTKDALAWSSWDTRVRSKTVEVGLLKVREGKTGIAKLWGDIRTNTILAHEPSLFGAD